ncbi:MAG: EamA family transporter [Pseudomonadota bacterium]
MPEPSRQTALIQLHLGSLLLAGTAIFTRTLPLAVDQIVLLRCVIAAAVLLAITLFVRDSFRVKNAAELGWLVLCALLIGVHWLTYYRGIQLGGVAIAVVCMFTYPIITAFIEPLFGETKLSRGDVLAGVAVLTGVALVARPDAGAAWTASWLCLLSALVYALRNVLHRRHLRERSAYGMMGWQFLIVALCLLPTLDTSTDFATDGLWWKFLIYGTVFTAAPHLLFVASMRALSAKTMGLINSLMPLYATTFAWLILGESTSWNTLAGGALIVGAAFYESFKAR